jgi:hypothetical protein
MSFSVGPHAHRGSVMLLVLDGTAMREHADRRT